MPRALLLTNMECEGPGLWGEFLREDGIEVRRVRVNDGEPIPDTDHYDIVIVFGGSMNADEDDQYPWLTVERDAIRRSVESDQAVVGLCLGSQLLARSLGAVVTSNPVKEIGWDLVTLTEAGQDDAAFKHLPSLLPVFQWHGDTFALPEGATLLATSTRCMHQAFRAGDRTYGLQFHVELTPDMVAEWVDEYAAEVAAELPEGAGARMVAQAHAAAVDFRTQSRRIYENLLGVV
jgi:GMP synthase (glutamine-hydrolysing)